MIPPVAVIGGGVAGAATCLRLLKLDITPLWLTAPPAGECQPGEHLSALGREIVGSLGAGDLLEREYHRPAHSVISCWGSHDLRERHAFAGLDGPGVILDRAGFERDLRDRVVAAGAQLEEGTVGTIESHSRGWRVEVEGGPARDVGFLFDATGRRARLAGSRSQLFRADQLLAAVAFLERSELAAVPTRATMIEAAPNGWWYACLLADERLSVAYFTDPDLLPPGITKQPEVLAEHIETTTHLSRWVREAGFQVRQPARVVSAGTSWLAPCAGDRWAAVGDAAAAFDPLSSHGMTTALWTGASAAEAYVIWCGGDSSGLERYAFQVASGVADYLPARTEVYARETRFAASPFWRRRSSASTESARA